MNFSWLQLLTILHQPTFLLRRPVSIKREPKQNLGINGVAIVLLLSTTAWILSPEYSPLSSVHDEDGDGVQC